MKWMGELIPLPAVRHDGEMSVERAITERRSVRDYADETLSLSALSQLLWATQGVTEKLEVPPGIQSADERMGGLRSAPSAGGLYPLEVYVVAGDGGRRKREFGSVIEHRPVGEAQGSAGIVFFELCHLFLVFDQPTESLSVMGRSVVALIQRRN